jgi:hypothetical protein
MRVAAFFNSFYSLNVPMKCALSNWLNTMLCVRAATIFNGLQMLRAAWHTTIRAMRSALTERT